MGWLYKKLLTGALRKGLVALTVWLVARGVLDQSDQSAILPHIAEWAPAIAAFIWDWIEKKQDAKHRIVAIQASGMTPERIAAEAKTVKLTKVA